MYYDIAITSCANPITRTNGTKTIYFYDNSPVIDLLAMRLIGATVTTFISSLLIAKSNYFIAFTLHFYRLLLVNFILKRITTYLNNNRSHSSFYSFFIKKVAEHFFASM